MKEISYEEAIEALFQKKRITTTLKNEANVSVSYKFNDEATLVRRSPTGFTDVANWLPNQENLTYFVED